MTQHIPSLYKRFEKDFKIGAAINEKTINTSKQLLLKHFNSITAENEMKFESLHPTEDEYNFEISDKFIQFAQNHGIAIRGHTLVWHNQTSDWLFKGRGQEIVNAETLLIRMKNHINTVVGRYKGKIYSWDVVNEVISDEKDKFYRDSNWYHVLGESFIEKAFEYAHEADQSAKLFYNDYNESNPIKRDKIFELVKKLKNKDIPIHGVGMQAHWNIHDPSLDEIRQAIEKYASLDLEIQMTEMDISMFSPNDTRIDLRNPTKEMQCLQDERYDKLFDVFKEYKEHIGAVTFWGVADDYTWLNDFPVKGRENWPLIFDQTYNPKESFWRVIK